MTSMSIRRTPARALPGGVWLHIRARHLQWIIPAMLLLSTGSWQIAKWLANYPYFDGPNARAPVAIAAPLVAAIALSATLSGADSDLECSTARLSIRWRSLHAIAAALIPGTLLAIAATDQPEIWGSYALVRNTIGMVGIILITASVLPPKLSWAPTLAYVLVVYLAAPRTATYGSSWWAWPMQPGAPDASWIAAGLLFTAGILVYGHLGSTGVINS